MLLVCVLYNVPHIIHIPIAPLSSYNKWFTLKKKLTPKTEKTIPSNVAVHASADSLILLAAVESLYT